LRSFGSEGWKKIEVWGRVAESTSSVAREWMGGQAAEAG
jgi:hypothetical protein